MAKVISIEELNKQIKLKPSFRIEVSDVNIREKFADEKNNTFKNIKIKCLDEHIWLSMPKSEEKYYSPRLHIEIEQKEQVNILHCTFGPNPNLWTLFMFVHFFLGLSFLGLIVWLYTNITLNSSTLIVYLLMFLIVLCWIGLYVFARKNRKKAAPQSRKLINALSRLLS